MTQPQNRIHLFTDRLALCRPDDNDIQAIFEIHADPETNRFNPAGPMQGIEDAAEILAKWKDEWREKGWGYWSVVLRNDPDRVIGFGGISAKPRLGSANLVSMLAAQNAANLYFRFRPETWGKGYANEMAMQAMQFGFTHAGLDRVLGKTRESNLSSRKAMERLGLSLTERASDPSGAEANMMYAIDAATFRQIHGFDH